MTFIHRGNALIKKPLNGMQKSAWLILLALIVAGCSFKTLYNQLDVIIPSYVEGMVTLDDLLEEKLEKRTKVLIAWHRKTQLLEYAKWLRDLQKNVTEGITQAELQQHIRRMDVFWDTLSDRLNDEMASLLPLLNQKQQKELYENIAENNRDFQEEYVDITEENRMEEQVERVMDSYENWLGDLEEEQQQRITRIASKLQSTAGLRYARRIEWQKNIERILKTDKGMMVKTDLLKQYFTSYQREGNEVIQATHAENKKLLAGLTVEITNSLTPEQKAHFITTTNDYIRMLEELAAEKK